MMILSSKSLPTAEQGTLSESRVPGFPTWDGDESPKNEIDARANSHSATEVQHMALARTVVEHETSKGPICTLRESQGPRFRTLGWRPKNETDARTSGHPVTEANTGPGENRLRKTRLHRMLLHLSESQGHRFQIWDGNRKMKTCLGQ